MTAYDRAKAACDAIASILRIAQGRWPGIARAAAAVYLTNLRRMYQERTRR